MKEDAEMDEERNLIPSTEEFAQDSIEAQLAFLHNLTPPVLEFAVQSLMYAADYLQKQLARCESPIEQLMYFALDDMVRFDNGFLCYQNIPGQVILQQQPTIKTPKGEFRPDFLVTAQIQDKEARIAIECDGHDYHERTKEQAAYDKARDRALTAAGYTMLRFTGSEIWRDPTACAEEVSHVLTELTSVRF